MASVHLQLSEREAKDIRTALSIRLVGMRQELVHTDDREYRADLKAALERLELFLERLDLAMAGLDSDNVGPRGKSRLAIKESSDAEAWRDDEHGRRRGDDG